MVNEKEGLVYATHYQVAGDGGMVPGNGVIFFYSFNTGKKTELGFRKSSLGIREREPFENFGLPEDQRRKYDNVFNPNLVKILFAARGSVINKLFDAGEYGIYDTLENRCLLEGEVVRITSYMDSLYVTISSSHSRLSYFMFSLNDTLRIEERWIRGKEDYILLEEPFRLNGAATKTYHNAKSNVLANGTSYGVKNDGIIGGSIIGLDDEVVVISCCGYIDDVVAFPEDVILSKFKQKESIEIHQKTDV